MKKIIIVSVLLFLLCAVAMTKASAQDVTIEDDSLSALPQDVIKAVKRVEKDRQIKACTFVGVPIDLDGNDNATDFFVTTADACGWGAALGPIWIVRSTGRSYSLVLSDVGYGATLQAQKTKGLANITIWAATAGWESSTPWVFNGRKYTKGDRIFKDLSGRK
jgi:hypothetical protein